MQTINNAMEKYINDTKRRVSAGNKLNVLTCSLKIYQPIVHQNTCMIIAAILMVMFFLQYTLKLNLAYAKTMTQLKIDYIQTM